MKKLKCIFLHIGMLVLSVTSQAQVQLKSDDISLKLQTAIHKTATTLLNAILEQKADAFTNDSLIHPFDTSLISKSSSIDSIHGLSVRFRETPNYGNPNKKIELFAVAPLVTINMNGIHLPAMGYAYIPFNDLKKILSPKEIEQVTILANLLFGTSTNVNPIFPMEDYDFYDREEMLVQDNFFYHIFTVKLHAGTLKHLGGILLTRSQDIFDLMKVNYSSGFFKDIHLKIPIQKEEFRDYLRLKEVFYTNTGRTDSIVRIFTDIRFGYFSTLIFSDEVIGLKLNNTDEGAIVFMDKRTFLKKLDKWELALFELVVN